MPGEVGLTEATFADAEFPIADMPLIVLAKVDPCCSSFTRWALGVDPLKNFSQLDLIATVDPLPDSPDGPLVGAAWVEADGLEAGLGLELWLLEQEVIAIVTVIAVTAVIVAASIGRDIPCASLGGNYRVYNVIVSPLRCAVMVITDARVS